MFEKLTAGEAEMLMKMLTSGYESSRQLAREMYAWMKATPDFQLQQSYNLDLIAQGAIRAENTSIRWQVKREAQS